MNTLDQKAVEILNAYDSKFYIDMVDPLQIGIGETILAYDDGVLINVRGTLMWMAANETRGIQLAEYVKNHFNTDRGLVVHDEVDLKASCEILDLSPGVPCYLAACFSKEKFDIKTDAEIKILSHDYDNLVWKTYGFFKDYDWGLQAAKESIDAGVYGAFVNGECAGFIGTHIEGTMGMLEILPQFRRRGYGEALEKYLVNKYLDQNRCPYCHIWKTNSASIALQKSMGFWLSDGKFLNWLQEK